jgi:hypothetical protein
VKVLKVPSGHHVEVRVKSAGNGGYFEKSKDVFLGISTNTWDFDVLIADSESSEIDDSEYIGISWIDCVG